MSRARMPPRATYRLQLNADFTFDDAAAIIPYLAKLGISHVYCSPYLAARPGSRHGYDIVNHAELNPELGGRDAFERFVEVLADHGMSHICDFVPNHMGVGRGDNPWWLDVLEWGRASQFASFFDIDWEPLKPELHGKVMLPILGNHYGEVLEAGELRLVFDAAAGTFAVEYFEHRMPIWPRHYASILREAGPAFGELAGDFAGLARRTRHPPRQMIAAELKTRLARLVAQDLEARAGLDRALALFNGTPGTPRSFVRLHQLLEGQAYRLCYWGVAADEINYRRFFDVNDLAAIRVESQDVFAATHSLVLSLIDAGKLDGLRIDHIDGLYDPYSYCRRLRQRIGDHYLVVEKILGEGEPLREDWPVNGTTGYDFMNDVTGLLIDPRGERPLTRLYHHILHDEPDYDRVLYESKMYVMRFMLASELQVLASELDRIAKLHWRSRDISLTTLRDGLAEIVAWFPVYRTYVTGRGSTHIGRGYVREAMTRAAAHSLVPPRVFDFIADVLTTELLGGERYGYVRQRVVRFAMKFQQYTAPVMAKGAEDTAFYRYHRLIAVNEVGGDPRRFSLSIERFHAANALRASRWPAAMLATMTHDAKRGEDMRARLSVLSELPEEWAAAVQQWRRMNRRLKGPLDDNDEYLLYQTLVGCWPEEAPLPDNFASRIKEYMIKALREAKLRSSWIRPNESYEASTTIFVDRVLASSPFVSEMDRFVRRIAGPGARNGLAQTLLRLAAPGVPDTYQGSELWDYRLVDPDNRRAVDYAKRFRALDALAEADPMELLKNWHDGRVKLLILYRLLQARAAQPELFAAGAYLPIAARGPLAQNLCAFARVHDSGTVLALTPRHSAHLAADPAVAIDWHGTALALPPGLPARQWRNLFTNVRVAPEGRNLPLDRAFDGFPVALLVAS